MFLLPGSLPDRMANPPPDVQFAVAGTTLMGSAFLSVKDISLLGFILSFSPLGFFFPLTIEQLQRVRPLCSSLLHRDHQPTSPLSVEE